MPLLRKPIKLSNRLGLKEFVKITAWVFKIYTRITPVYTILFLVTTIINDLKEFINALLFAKIIDTLIKVTQTPNASLDAVLPYVLLVLVYNIIDSILSNVSWYCRERVVNIASPKIDELFSEHLKYLGIQTLEQPETSNKVWRADKTLGELPSYLGQTTMILSQTLKLITSALLLTSASPLLIGIIIAINGLDLIVDRKFRMKYWKFTLDNTEERRRSKKNMDDVSSSKMLQEILLNGSFNFFKEKYLKFTLWYKTSLLNISLKSRIYAFFINLLSDVVLLFGLVQIIKNLISKLITVGDLTFQFRVLSSFRDTLGNLNSYINNLYENAIQIKDTYDLFAQEPIVVDGAIAIPKMDKGPKITLNHVDFSYPNTPKKVLQNINLTIKSGEKVAIIGANGAGKTTLVKLIGRIYMATEGTILINDLNINDLKAENYYQSIGILFQDFNIHDQITVRENIIIGNLDIKETEDLLKNSAESADALKFIEEYPKKFNQLLGEKYKGGIRPSTGQWQKLAIARFFYRNAPLVIFDEPTASIDAVSEYSIFNKIYEFFKGKTVIIISHRFSTVRNADRIVVLDQGKIIEEGTHDQLMALNGAYAKAFMLQAEGYATKTESTIY